MSGAGAAEYFREAAILTAHKTSVSTDEGDHYRMEAGLKVEFSHGPPDFYFTRVVKAPKGANALTEPYGYDVSDADVPRTSRGSTRPEDWETWIVSELEEQDPLTRNELADLAPGELCAGLSEQTVRSYVNRHVRELLESDKIVEIKGSGPTHPGRLMIAPERLELEEF